jgi:chromosome segregation ATPase
MKPILNRENVAKAMQDLKDNGKAITLGTLHAALGFRGSMTTVNKLFKEIKASEKPTAEPNEEALKNFREVWTRAMDEGRKQNETIIQQQDADLQALGQENERLDGLAMAAQEQAEILQKEKSSLESELARARADLGNQLSQAQTALVEANQRVSHAFEQLAQTQSTHAKEMAALLVERDAAVAKSHGTELELATCKARLETK